MSARRERRTDQEDRRTYRWEIVDSETSLCVPEFDGCDEARGN